MDKSMAEVSRDLDINYKTLGNWVRAEQARQERDGLPGAISESEREILRKAAAYFVKETIRRSASGSSPSSPRTTWSSGCAGG
jgi:transposase-like protein